MHTFDDSAVDRQLIHSRRIAILGYGAQGRAQALNLRDAGVDLVVGLREESPSRDRVRADGLRVAGLDEAAGLADVVMFMLPDEAQPAVYETHVAANLRDGGALGFAHGFNVHYQCIVPREDLDVILAAPKGAAGEVRAAYEAGSGVVFLVGVAQDASGRARDLALSYAAAQGADRAGILGTSFAAETETDLFGEQAVLCGGVGELIQAAFQTLVDAGYAPELAYFECLHELKFIADLLQEGGFQRMHEIISTTAAFGAVTRGPRVVSGETRTALRGILADIQSGAFAREFLADSRRGSPTLVEARRRLAQTRLETTGRRLRGRMQRDASG